MKGSLTVTSSAAAASAETVVDVLKKSINIKNINSHVKSASYAVRGPIVARAQEIAKTRPIISCNIGNPHALNQKSLTYMRDVLSLVMNPTLSARSKGTGLFSDDVIERANKYINAIPSVGAYTDSQGILAVRQEVCQFLEERDGYPANPSNIFLTNGASEGVRLCMQTIIRNPASGFTDGVLTPIPQYPLYSALSTLLQAELLPYYLDEKNAWGCSIQSLNKALKDAKDNGITPRALVVINPGNPTGQILPESVIREIVAWCHQEKICLMADEVYQENIWNKDCKFVSIRKIANELNVLTGEDPLRLVSFHSTSKGFLGECGLRGGYFEVLGFPQDVQAELLKLASISLCSNTIGQIATGIMVQPPKQHEASYNLYEEERNNILASLNRRAIILSGALNKLEGVSCNAIDGALYAFPTITIPDKAIKEAASRGVEADAMYCMDLLEETGVVVVPGSGFKQVEGTYHFRITILPSEDKIDSVVTLITNFHEAFMAKYK